jgi:hypothetical protein
LRYFAGLAALLLSTSIAWAHGMDDRAPDAHEIASLEARAVSASPNEQPYLYAELVHSMTEIATAQYQAGDYEHATRSLKVAQSYALKPASSRTRKSSFAIPRFVFGS